MEEGWRLGLKEWLILLAIVIYLLFAIPVLIDNHKTIKRMEANIKKKK